MQLFLNSKRSIWLLFSFFNAFLILIIMISVHMHGFVSELDWVNFELQSAHLYQNQNYN